MTYQFQAVDIFAFDVHTAVKALAFPELVRPVFDYLVHPDKYRKRCADGQAVETDQYRVECLKWREREYGRFWPYYIGLWPGAETDFWGLQVPFVYKPKKINLRLMVDAKTFQANVHPTVFLNSMGWSTSIYIRLFGNLSADELQGIVAKLRGTVTDAAVFEIEKVTSDKPGGNEKIQTDLSGLLEHFAALMKKELYVKATQVSPKRTTDRFIVTSIARYTGPPPKHFPRYRQPSMADDERATMLSILGGETVQVGVNLKEKEEKVLCARFKGRGFALARFYQAVLLFIQDRAVLAPDRETRWKLHCLAANVRSSLMMSFASLAFHEEASGNYLKVENVKTLKENLRELVPKLRGSYKNSLFSIFYLKFTPFEKLIASTQESDAAESQT
jgi:hypothetical protein